MIRRIWRWSALLAFLAVASACEKSAPPQRQGRGTEDLPGRTGMPMRMPSLEMMAAMRAHVDSLATLPPEQMMDLLAAHDSMARRMLDAMEGDMGAMGMAGDATWSALLDSVRQDLRALPSLSGEDLILRARAHAGRMRRLLRMHEGMMQGMHGGMRPDR